MNNPNNPITKDGKPDWRAMLDAMNHNQQQMAVLIKEVAVKVLNDPKELVQVAEFLIARYKDEADEPDEDDNNHDDSFSA